MSLEEMWDLQNLFFFSFFLSFLIVNLKGNNCFIGCTSLFASICIRIHININMLVSVHILRLSVCIYMNLCICFHSLSSVKKRCTLSNKFF